MPGSNQKLSGKLGPHLLGDSPKINIPLPEKDLGEGAEGSNGSLSSLKIFDEDVDLRFLVCGLSCTLVCLSPPFSHLADSFIHRVIGDIILVNFLIFAGCLFVGFTGGWSECIAEY